MQVFGIQPNRGFTKITVWLPIVIAVAGLLGAGFGRIFSDRLLLQHNDVQSQTEIRQIKEGLTRLEVQQGTLASKEQLNTVIKSIEETRVDVRLIQTLLMKPTPVRRAYATSSDFPMSKAERALLAKGRGNLSAKKHTN